MQRATVCCLGLLAIAAAGCARHDGSAALQASPAAVAFETRTEIAVAGPSVADGTLADLDGDRDLDLVVTTLDGSAGRPAGVVEVLRNDRGVFTSAQTLPAPGFAVQVCAGDVDGDQDLDLVVLRSMHALIAVLTNDGNARFTPRQEIGIEPDADSMALGDCDLDGDLDVMLAYWTRSSAVSGIAMREGLGNGTFATTGSAIALPPGATATALVMHDIDADGRADLVAADPHGDQLLVFRALPAGGHADAQAIAVGPTPVGIAAGDLDQDGAADLAVSNAGDDTVSVLRGGPGGLAEAQRLQLSGAPAKNAIGDVTGDGVPDLVVCTFAQAYVSVFPGRGGALGAELRTSASGLPYRPAIGDVNGDGAPDLLVTGSFTPFVNLWLGGAAGSSMAGSADVDPGVAAPEFLAVADLNLDGRSEIAVAGTGGTQVALLALADGEPSLHAVAPVRAPLEIGRPVRGVLRFDADRDGRTDLAVTTAIGVKLLHNVSSAGGPEIDLELVPAGIDDVIVPGVGPFGVAAADMDGDARLDLIVSDATLGRVSVARALDAELAYELVPGAVALSGVPGGLAVADFDGDGYPDVAVARNGAAFVTILANDGTGALAVAVEEPVGAGPNYLRTADFDRDGRPDLAVSNAVTDEVTVLLNRSGWTFLQHGIATGAVPTGLLAEDFDGNGAPDLVVASLAGGDFRVILGAGSGGFAAPMRFPGTYRATSLDAGNVDGDLLGRREIVIASTQTDRISIYRNAGAAVR